MLLSATVVLAQRPAEPQQPAEGNLEIAAEVDGDPISAAEVDREIAIAFGDREIAAESRDSLRAWALEQLIRRRLVQRWLRETRQAPSESEIDLAVSQFEKRLVQRGSTIEEFLLQQQLDMPGLRRGLAWQIGWQRFLDKRLTDNNLQKFFQKHRREFDGSEIRVAHVLFKVERPGDPASWQSARKRAAEVLRHIRAGEMSFADAARHHSDSPSKEQGGDIGRIARREPMPESFSREAFRLQPGEVSEPVTTPFGVHLIQCLEVYPGQQRWQDVRAELEQSATEFLFQWASEQVRPQAQIEYAPGFRKLAASEQ